MAVVGAELEPRCVACWLCTAAGLLTCWVLKPSKFAVTAPHCTADLQPRPSARHKLGAGLPCSLNACLFGAIWPARRCRMRRLPPWGHCPVNGRVLLLLLPPPSEAGWPDAAAVVQSAFTHQPLRSDSAGTSSSPAAASANVQPETLSFVVSSRQQVLRLLLSHRGRPGQPAHPMGFDHPLGSKELQKSTPCWRSCGALRRQWPNLPQLAA